jgi:hypothetical protein
MASTTCCRAHEIEIEFLNNPSIKPTLKKTRFFNIYNNNYKTKSIIDIYKKANISCDIGYI